MASDPNDAAPDLGSPGDGSTDRWGIQHGYHDVHGGWQVPTPEVAAALRTAMGATTADPGEVPPAGRPLHIVRPGQAAAIDRPGPTSVVLEDGTVVALQGGHLPPDLPLGYHRLLGETARSGDDPHVAHLIVAPERAHLDDAMRAWGITAQLYAARSRTSWGIGDLGDLGDLVRWTEGRGGRTIGLNPLHASSPGAPPANSPYSPSSRRWRDPIYLDIEQLLADADAGTLPRSACDDAISAGRALSAGDRIDRAAVWAHKSTVLEQLWELRRGTTPPPAADLVDAGIELWGTSCAIAEVHGPNWRAWPDDLRRPDAPGVRAFEQAHADRVRFWSWLQALLVEQLQRAGAQRLVVTDLAVGFDPNGFDAWEWQDHLAHGCRIGAPPDLLGPDGQDWGLPPFIPSAMRSAGYQPFAQTLRANLTAGSGLRIDHVMGLLRLYWIPPGFGAADGAYVRWNGTELLDIVALESARAGAFVVGEDLGTVEPGVREQLRDRGVLSTRLLWFEDDAPEQWPAQSMAAITTHDLPTVAGVWSGVDLADQLAAGVTVPDDGDEQFRHRLRVAAAVPDGTPVDQVVVAAHRRLADAPSMLVTAALDDLLGAEHRPNVPGTIDEHPNWRIPLPRPIDDLEADPLATSIVDALRTDR